MTGHFILFFTTFIVLLCFFQILACKITFKGFTWGKTLMDIDKKTIHSVVVGMGPAGLTSALNLLILGHHVTLIDKRTDYTLKQKVRIPEALDSEVLCFYIGRGFLKKTIGKW